MSLQALSASRAVPVTTTGCPAFVLAVQDTRTVSPVFGVRQDGRAFSRMSRFFSSATTPSVTALR